ncbi:MAG: polymer-forming cytoskeletal protein [Dysgonomonas sp.]
MKWRSNNNANTNTETVRARGEVQMPSILSPSVVVKGEISVVDDLRIDGTVEGNIKSEGRVIIGAKGCVNGNIESSSIELMGRINGDVIVHDIFILKSTSFFKGEVNTSNLEIEPGAHFFGNCKMKDNANQFSEVNNLASDDQDI